MIEYLRAAEVATKLGTHRANIYGRIKAGTMPEPDAVIRGAPAGRRGDGTVFLWLPETIDAWARQLPTRTWLERDRAQHPRPAP